MPTALITGASKGFGLAIADRLADDPDRAWDLIITARDRAALATAEAQLRGRAGVVMAPGDVTDPAHRGALADHVAAAGGLDLLVNNASALGPSPLPAVAAIPLDDYRLLLETNLIAPLALFQALRPHLLRRGGTVINVSSDAARGAWEGWGPYGSTKAALDQLSAVMAVEDTGLRIYALDPGDMRTDMHQAAFPGEDITDRPEASTVAPAVMALLSRRPASGRVLAADLLTGASA